jgi:RimJ/RimL family protein N-acetyltransferase
MTLTEEVVAYTPQRHEIPVLKTERLILRKPRLADVKAIAQIANDRRISENTARIPHPYTTEDAEQFVTSVNRRDSDVCFVVICSGKPIGICSVDLREDNVELGYWLGAPYWGHGFATEAARVAIDYAFGDLGHKTLLSGARVSNPASRRVLEKCGFQWTSVRLVRILSINSAAPVDRFRLDRGLWESLKSWRPAKRVA